MTFPASRWLRLTAFGLVPGLAAAIQLSGLLFFLNPDLPFTIAAVLRGIAVYGLLFGGLTVAVHLAVARTDERRAQRLLPWGLTAVLGLAALVDWYNASYFGFYLPPGINERLIKAALWLTLATLITFYTALLHTLHGRRYGTRTRVGLALLALAATYVILERREAFRPPPTAPARPPTLAAVARPRILVVGLDGASLDALLPLAEHGRLPFFADLLQEGARARLSTLTPVESIPLWTTLATGKYPYRHGLVAPTAHSANFLAQNAELRLLPVGVFFSRWGTFGASARPLAGESRRALAGWEILARLGIRVGLIGWPASSPAPHELAFAVSDQFFDNGDSAAPVGDVQPDDLAPRATLFRVERGELDPRERRRFGSAPPPAILDALAGDLWRESLATYLIEPDEEVEVFFLSLPGLAEVSRRTYGAWSAVEFEGERDPRAARAATWLAGYYEHLDAFLATLWQETPAPRLLLVVSAHGVAEPSGWQRAWGEVWRRPAFAGNFGSAPDGLLLARGAGVRAGAVAGGGRLADLLPTILYGLGFPIARDLDGQALTALFEPSFLARHPLTFIPSYEILRSKGGG